ncbi:MAG: GTPase Era [Terriglobales bacterium]
MSTPKPFRSGFVTLVGRPNTGKSTLVNALVGRKVAAVTPHPQTTRTHLLGVLHTPGAQAVFVDTPGIHRGRGPLARELARSVCAALEGRDLSLFVRDVSRPWGSEDAQALELLRGEATPPVFLVLNKIDRLPRLRALLPIIAAERERYRFAEVVPVSALRRLRLDDLLRLVVAALPEGPEYFPSGQSTDQPEQFWISEIIREQAMLATHAEVPHALAVQVEADRRVRSRGVPLRVLEAVLICERESQKAILVGRGGAMIRRIGTAARQQLETALQSRVLLKLQVLVRGGWREDAGAVANLDFHHMG